MSKYIGATVVNLSVDTVDVTGDITTTDATPEVIIVNDTHEDTDGGREGKVTFKGQQSGGEETTLAEIQASHDGTSDDEKGDLIFKTNDGSDGTSPTERMRIDSEGLVTVSGSLDLGTTTDAASVSTTASDYQLQLGAAQSTTGDIGRNISFDISGTTTAAINSVDGGTSNAQALAFFTGNSSGISEAVRIDSSRNVLVGKTAVGSTAGIEFRGSIGYSSFTRDGNFPVTARRLTDDGDIVQFEKDNTEVGSIASRSGSTTMLHLNPSSTNGAGIGGATKGIIPTDHSTISDDNINLGSASYRFKNLYLSGGVYVGGTTSANYLTDYEEGTFTPTLDVTTMGSLSLDTGSDTCSYVKIGNLVTCIGSVAINGSGGSGNLRLTNFPFAMNTGLTEEAELSAVTVNLYNTAVNVNGIVNGEMSNVSGDATLLIRDGGGTTSGVAAMGDHLGASSVIRFSAIYRTT